MRGMVAVLAAALLVGVSCSGTNDSSPPIERCAEPPHDALRAAGDFVLELSPNPVTAGELATPSVSYDREGDPIDGAGAEWQCWTGATWESTHQLLKDWTGDGPNTRSIEPGAEVTVPAIGLPGLNAYTVRIPEVAPGTFRIVNEGNIDGRTSDGIVIVTVR